MTVDVEAAREIGLVTTRDGVDYAFFGKGCQLEFRDDPVRYLDPRGTFRRCRRGRHQS